MWGEVAGPAVYVLIAMPCCTIPQIRSFHGWLSSVTEKAERKKREEEEEALKPEKKVRCYRRVGE